MKTGDNFNIDGIANQIFKDMKNDGEGFNLFDHYWHRIQVNMLIRGFEASEMAILEGLVMKKVEEMFEQEK